jgi:lipid-A-disaccharide synthase
MKRGLRLVLVAGEASGDLHGAALVRALRERQPDLQVAGIGGEQLRLAGMRTVVDAEEVSTMGFSETFGTIGKLLSAYRAVVALLDRERPDLVVLIDYPEFNLMVARQAKRRGIPVFYFIGPQVWAWRRGRVRKIRRRVDRMGLVFPFEPALYNEGREIASFIGHPLLDVARATRTREETRRLHGLDPDRPLLALLPGSRKKEIAQLLAPMRAAAGILAAEGWQAALALAPGIAAAEVAPVGTEPAAVRVVSGDTYNLLAAADAAVVASGTATLESALLGCPMVIVYRMARLTYWLARLLVRVNCIGMPNIILERAVFPELIQDEVEGEALAAAVRSLGERRAEIERALAEVRTRLGEPGAAARAADLALELVA